nr:hypothetical protein [Tanacetum cinerariifolium]
MLVHAVETIDNSPAVPEHTTVETPLNMSTENKAYFLAEKEAIHLILIAIGDDIYSTIDACQTPKWSRFVTIIKQQHKLDEVSYYKLFDILKKYQNEVNELHAEKLARNANPLALVATAQANKEIAKPITPPSETASEEDSDLEQAQRDKDMQKNLALIAKYFKKIYKPTNNNLRTSSNSKNKNVDTTPRYKNDSQSGQFRNQRMEYGYFAKECRKPKRVKDSAYHKEKMLLCKQAEQGVPLQAEQYDWLAETDEEVDEQEPKAHYSYMAKIQEVPTANSSTDSEPLEQLLVCYDDDDDEERSNSLKDNIISGLPPCSAITPNEPIDSLSMGDEHLNTIPTTESDKFIKSSVENLVPNPSESEGEYECDVPPGFTTFYNVLFDADYDFDSGDDLSFFDEDFPKKIYSNPLFNEEIMPMKIDQHPFNAESDLIESMPNHDSSIIISSKIDSLFDEFAGELTLFKSILSGINETDCHPKKETRFTKRLLYENSSTRPPKEFVSDNSDADIKSFSSSPILIKDSDSRMEEIDLTFSPDDPMPPGIEDDDYDSERDIPILKELLDNYSLSLPDKESYHFDIPSSSRPHAKPPDGNTGTLNIKMMGDVSEQKVPMPGLMITLVPKQEKSHDLLPHQGLEAFQPSAEWPMMINGKNTPILDVPLFHFYPP